MDSCKYFSSSYKAICQIPLRDSKWILALGREFLTLGELAKRSKGELAKTGSKPAKQVFLADHSLHFNTEHMICRVPCSHNL